MEWTNEERLKLIKALAAQAYYNGPQGETHQMLMERIMFLCDMPASFLETSKEHYEDATKLAKAEWTVEV